MEKTSDNLTHLKIKENYIADYDKYYLSFDDLLKLGVKTFIYIFLICIAFYKSILLLLVLLPFSLVYPFFCKKELTKKRKDKLLLEFKDFLRILKTFLEASYSVENSFYLSIKELMMIHGKNSMMVKELKYMVAKLKLSKPIDEVFKDFALKTHVEDILDFSEVFVISKISGGNLSKIIGNTISVINDKIEVKIEIETATASKRFEQKLMNLLPFLIVLYMNISSSNFLKPLYTTFQGRILMTFALVIIYFAIKLSEKILDIEM